MDAVNATTGDADRTVEHGKNIKLYYSEDAIVKICITAPAVAKYTSDNPYIEFTEGLHADFFNGTSGNVTSTLDADYGIRYEKELKTVVRRNVVVVNEKNETLHTEELTWDEKKHIIYTDKQVIIKTETDTIFGQGMEADEQFSRYTILKPGGSKIQVETKTDSSNVTSF
jgi:LPS export ABC transporter protein LptC